MMSRPLMFITYVFEGSAAATGWLILFFTFLLLIAVPVFCIVVGKKRGRGYLVALGSSLLPLIIGAVGTLQSLSLVHHSLNNAPAAMRPAALAGGISYALCPSFLGSISTSVLWIIAVACFIIVSRIRRDQLVMLAIGVVPIPALLCSIGWLYGAILKYDAIANVPVAMKELAVSEYQSVITASIRAGILLTLAGIAGFVFLFLRKRLFRNDAR
jgi:hypothetical protein